MIRYTTAVCCWKSPLQVSIIKTSFSKRNSLICIEVHLKGKYFTASSLNQGPYLIKLLTLKETMTFTENSERLLSHSKSLFFPFLNWDNFTKFSSLIHSFFCAHNFAHEFSELAKGSRKI